MNIAFIGVALLFFVGHALKWFFQKTKVPDVLILIALGYILGPVLNLVSVDDLGKVGPFLTTMALVVILYEGGVRLRAKELLHSSLPAAGLAVLGFVLTAGLAMLVGLIFQPWPVALLLGLGLGSTSSAVVIPMVRMLSISDRTKTVLSLESAFTDVLVIVMFLVIVDGVATHTFDTRALMVGLGQGTFHAVLLGIGAGLFWAFLESRFRTITRITFSSEAWACLWYGLLESFGYNGAMGVLALGFTLTNLDLLPNWARPVFSNQPVTRADLALLGELTFLLKTFFFIYLGMAVQVSDFQVLGVAALITLLIFLARIFMVKWILSPKSYSRVDAITSTAMGPRGLACAVLAAVPVQRGIEGGVWVQNVMYAIIPISIIATAVLVMLSERSAFRLRMVKLYGKYREDFGLAPTGIQPLPDGTFSAPPDVAPTHSGGESAVASEPLDDLGLAELDDDDSRKEPSFGGVASPVDGQEEGVDSTPLAPLSEDTHSGEPSMDEPFDSSPLSSSRGETNVSPADDSSLFELNGDLDGTGIDTGDDGDEGEKK